MTIKEIREIARGEIGPYCVSCPVCDGRACSNKVPGPGAKGSGTGFAKNYKAWQEISINMDTLVDNTPVDTTFDFFGHKMAIPVFAAPIGAMKLHYGDKYNDMQYNAELVPGCEEAGILAFTGDGVNPVVMEGAVKAIKDSNGCGVPTIKPWANSLVKEKIDMIKDSGAYAIAMDVDGAGLPFLKNQTPPAGRKNVEELKEITAYTDKPFIVKGIMTVKGAMKALEAGAAGIIVSNHGGRVLDQTPSTAEVLKEICDAVDGRMMVLVDGGIRSGIDVFKALALGADAVLIGRPFVNMVYGAGKEGIAAYVQQLKDELEDAMIMCGVHSLDEISSENLYLR